MNEERLRTLLLNAFVLLENEYLTGIMDCDLADELGITQEEYDEIMGGNKA